MDTFNKVVKDAIARGVEQAIDSMVMKLGAISVAAAANTTENYDQLSNVRRGHEAWTVAFDDVRRAVLREITTREQLEHLHAGLRQALGLVADVEAVSLVAIVKQQIDQCRTQDEQLRAVDCALDVPALWGKGTRVERIRHMVALCRQLDPKGVAVVPATPRARLDLMVDDVAAQLRARAAEVPDVGNETEGQKMPPEEPERTWRQHPGRAMVDSAAETPTDATQAPSDSVSS